MTTERIDVLAVQKATKALEDAYAGLKKARNDYKIVKGLNGQVGYAVTVNGVRVDVAVMNNHYNGELIRGREMIHLGALKALSGVIDQWERHVSACESRLAALARVGGA